MKHAFFSIKLFVIAVMLFEAPGPALSQDLPVIDGKKTVATVNDEPITLDELNKAIAAAHAERSTEYKAGRVDFSNIVKRLINTRLIVLEARNMGLDELPEIQKQVDQYSRQALMELLLEGYVKDIREDDEEVERRYKAEVREWKLRSVTFKKAQDATRFESQLKAGGNFDELVKKAAQWGIADADENGIYIRNKDLTPAVAQTVSQMEVGSISPILSIGKRGFIIFNIEDIRYPEAEDAAARRRARIMVLNEKKMKAARAYYQELKKKNVTVNETLLAELDYESEASAFDKLSRDKRVLVGIRGEKPITVKAFTEAVKMEFYHGVELAVESKRINKKKTDILENMIQHRVLQKEASKKGIDKTDEYAQRVQHYENSLIFDAFIKKVVTPDIKLTPQDLKTYFSQNAEEYTTPEMVRIKSLVFGKRRNAVEAIDKLNKGTDFNWLGANSDGQVDPNTKGLLRFDGRLITINSLTGKLKKTVSGSSAGDYRLYESAAGHFYVLSIYEVIPSKQRPFIEVRQEIAQKVFNERIIKTVEAWADKLREYYPVKIYTANLEK